ncbi:MAG: hypothetical protein ABFS45_23915, partial [Pseudomonadota bacterium]
LATAHNARRDLDQLDETLKIISAEKNAVQEALYKFLARQGEAPRGGAADVESLSAALDRVARLAKT